VVRVHDSRTGRERFAFPSATDFLFVNPLLSLWLWAFSPDGTHLAVYGNDGAVRGYDLRMGRVAFTLRGRPSNQPCLRFSPDCTRLAVAGEGGVVRVYDVRTDPEALHFPAGLPAFSPDGTRLALTVDRGLRVYDVPTDQEALALDGSGTGVAMFSSDGLLLARWEVEKPTQVYDARTGQTLVTLKAGWDVTFSPDGTLFATWSEGALRFLDSRTGQERFAYPMPKLANLRYSPDGTRLAGQGIGVLRVYEVHTGKEEAILRGPANLIIPVFGPDGRRIASRDAAGVVRVYDAHTGREVFVCQGPKDFGNPAFSPDGAYLAAGQGDGPLRVYDTRTGREVLTIAGSPLDGTPAFSPDGTRLAAAGRDGLVRVYDARTGQDALTLRGPNGLHHPVFSPDGSRLVAASFGAIRMWRAPKDAATLQVERRQSLAGSAPAWYRVRAADGERDGEWFAAAFHWGWLAKAVPDSGQPHLRRGLALAHLGQTAAAKGEFEKALALKNDLGHFEQSTALAEVGRWDEARTLYARAVEAPDASPLALAAQAVPRLLRGDRTGYTAVCETLLNRFGKTEDAFIANNVAWSCALGPDAVPDLKPAVALARLAVRTTPKDANYRNTLGAVLFRAGEYQESVRVLNESIQLHGKGGTALDYLFLAMAHHKLDQPDEARAWLDKGLRVNQSEKTLPENERLELQLLRREAEALLNGRSALKKE
jgi:WD40 repeat protein/Flp pilus assembly protein TadD